MKVFWGQLLSPRNVQQNEVQPSQHWSEFEQSEHLMVASAYMGRTRYRRGATVRADPAWAARASKCRLDTLRSKAVTTRSRTQSITIGPDRRRGPSGGRQRTARPATRRWQPPRRTRRLPTAALLRSARLLRTPGLSKRLPEPPQPRRGSARRGSRTAADPDRRRTRTTGLRSAGQGKRPGMQQRGDTAGRSPLRWLAPARPGMPFRGRAPIPRTLERQLGRRVCQSQQAFVRGAPGV